MKNYGFLSFWCQNGATEDAGCLHGLFLHEATKKGCPPLGRHPQLEIVGFYYNCAETGFLYSAVIDRHGRVAYSS